MCKRHTLRSAHPSWVGSGSMSLKPHSPIADTIAAMNGPTGQQGSSAAVHSGSKGYRSTTGASAPDVRIAVIGAGPHGLAAAAHLRAAGVEPLVFGDPMEFWRENMPEGMLLRSALHATNIASPGRFATLDRWSAETGRELSFPLPRHDFLDYAAWYQRQLVPDIDRRKVSQIARENGGLVLRLENGDEVRTAAVAVAAGIAPFARIPTDLSSLPATLMSHSSQHRDLARFAGRRVAVLGSGQSALESAALLKEAGANVEVIFRGSAIKWLTGPRPGHRRIELPYAPTDICALRSSWVTAAPDFFRRLPRAIQERVALCAGPAGGHWLPERVAGIPMNAGRTIVRAEPQNGHLRLELSDRTERQVDHLLLGTGYQVDLRRYEFLTPELADAIQMVNGQPVLGPGLESSVPGLHFLGSSAAYTFGPVMRFVTGTWYTAPALVLRIAGRRQPLLRWSF